MQVIDRVKELIGPIAKERECYIVDITYKREGGGLVLRVLADKEGGIAMDECTALNNSLSELLDKEGVIPDQYTLEVSSPGLDRKLKTDEDFTWALGKKVKITTYGPLDGKNVFEGVLEGIGEGTIVVSGDGIATEIPRKKIANARLMST